jgi:hypothetical protein
MKERRAFSGRPGQSAGCIACMATGQAWYWTGDDTSGVKQKSRAAQVAIDRAFSFPGIGGNPPVLWFCLATSASGI